MIKYSDNDTLNNLDIRDKLKILELSDHTDFAIKEEEEKTQGMSLDRILHSSLSEFPHHNFKRLKALNNAISSGMVRFTGVNLRGGKCIESFLTNHFSYINKHQVSKWTDLGVKPPKDFECQYVHLIDEVLEGDTLKPFLKVKKQSIGRWYNDEHWLLKILAANWLLDNKEDPRILLDHASSHKRVDVSSASGSWVIECGDTSPELVIDYLSRGYSNVAVLPYQFLTSTILMGEFSVVDQNEFQQFIINELTRN